MDLQYAQADHLQHADFDPVWGWELDEEAPGVASAVGQSLLALAGAGLALVSAAAVRNYKQLVIGNPVYQYVAASNDTRPAELYDPDDQGPLTPVPLPILRGIASPTTANILEVHKTTTFQLHWAAMVRAEFCGYGGTRAEQLCAARWLRLQLEEINVRKAHIASLTPMILVLAMVPTEDEDVAHKLSTSDEFLAVSGRLSWPRRLWRWIRWREYIAPRGTNFITSR